MLSFDYNLSTGYLDKRIQTVAVQINTYPKEEYGEETEVYVYFDERTYNRVLDGTLYGDEVFLKEVIYCLKSEGFECLGVSYSTDGSDYGKEYIKFNVESMFVV